MDLHNMNILDLLLGSIMIISILIGIVRGLVREMLSLFAWCIAIWIAWKFADLFSKSFVTRFISDEHIAYIASFGALFLVALFAIGLINLLITSLLSATGLTGFDRLLGALFGLARGAIIGSIFVFFAQLYPNIDQESWWKESKLTPGFVNIANWGIGKLPTNIRAKAEASLNSSDVGILIPLNQKTNSTTITDNANRPNTDTSAQTKQGNALSDMSSGIKLESMSDDSTIDQNIDDTQLDSNETPNNIQTPNIQQPILKLESIQ